MDNIPIYYINLNRSHDRRRRMEAMFRQWGLRATRLEAFDGSSLVGDLEALGRTVELPEDHNLSPGELGCTLSHLRAAEAVLEEDVEVALVMEDDIYLTYLPLWRTSLTEVIAQAPPDWQVGPLNPLRGNNRLRRAPSPAPYPHRFANSPHVSKLRRSSS